MARYYLQLHKSHQPDSVTAQMSQAKPETSSRYEELNQSTVLSLFFPLIYPALSLCQYASHPESEILSLYLSNINNGQKKHLLRSVVTADKHLVIRTVLFLYFTAWKLFFVKSLSYKFFYKCKRTYIYFSVFMDISLCGVKGPFGCFN